MSRTLRWAWIAIIVAALALRGGALNLAPLAPDEAEIALDAWIATRGQGWPQAGESPLLLFGNALLFTLFGAGDGDGLGTGCSLGFGPGLHRHRRLRFEFSRLRSFGLSYHQGLLSHCRCCGGRGSS